MFFLLLYYILSLSLPHQLPHPKIPWLLQPTPVLLKNPQRKIAELENVIKTLETSLAEHTAMIRIMHSNQSVASSIPPGASALALANAVAQAQEQQQQHHQQQQTLPSSPAHLFHSRQLSSSHMLSNTPTSPLVISAATTPIHSGSVHSRQLSTPAVLSKSLVTNSDVMRARARSPALAGLSVTQADILRSVTPSELLYASRNNDIQRSSADIRTELLRPQPRHGVLQLTPRELLARTGNQTSDLIRSATPTADLLRSTTPVGIDLNTGRRDSAPGDVLVHSFHKPQSGSVVTSHGQQHSLTGTT